MRGLMLRPALPMASFARRFARGAATDAFTALEHKMWQAGAAAYSDSFAKVTGMATTALLDNAHIGLTSAMAVSIVERTALESREGGLRVLDVATGPGMVADAAAARGHAEVNPSPNLNPNPSPTPTPTPTPTPHPNPNPRSSRSTSRPR